MQSTALFMGQKLQPFNCVPEQKLVCIRRNGGTWDHRAMSMQTIPTNIRVKKGERAVLTVTDGERWHIPFRPIGKAIDRCPESIDAVGYISEFTAAERFLFREVCRRTEDNNNVIFRMTSFPSAEQAKLKRAIRLWIKKGLLVRFRQEHYMVNPWFLVPPKKMHWQTMQRWSKLKTKSARPNARNRDPATV